MDYKYFYNKFLDKEFIFKEEFLFDLINKLDFDEQDAVFIIKYLKNKDSCGEGELKDILNKNTESEAESFLLFLNVLSSRLIVSKTVTSMIENTFIKFIEDLTSLTGGFLIYKSQLKVLYDIIGGTFMWEEYDIDESSPEYIKDYFLLNMMEYSAQYPNLTLKLMGIIDNIPLEEDEDFFEDCSLRNNLLVNLKRENIKTNKKPA